MPHAKPILEAPFMARRYADCSRLGRRLLMRLVFLFAGIFLMVAPLGPAERIRVVFWRRALEDVRGDLDQRLGIGGRALALSLET